VGLIRYRENRRERERERERKSGVVGTISRMYPPPGMRGNHRRSIENSS